jgi:hypothetical protein
VCVCVGGGMSGVWGRGHVGGGEGLGCVVVMVVVGCGRKTQASIAGVALNF